MNRHDTLAHRIKYAREYRQLTQITLARKSGLKQSDISKLETGRMSSTTAIVKLARALQCSVIWLDSGKGEAWNIEPNTSTDAYLINIPLIGSAFLSDTIDEFVEIVPNHAQLPYFSSDLDTYAIQCISDMLSPRVKLNEYVIVTPNHDITNGDEVLITNISGHIMIKQYAYSKNSLYYFSSVNRHNELFSLNSTVIKSMHFITGYIK